MPPQLEFEIDGRKITYSLDQDEVTIGRSADNDVVIRDALVSRRHARIGKRGQAWRVTDLGSSNGTRVNDRDPAGHDLRHGDRIQLHRFEIRFVDGSRPEMSLIAPTAATGGVDPLGAGTVIRSAVDFSALASMQKSEALQAGGEKRLERLLDIVTKASQALLSSPSLDATLNTVLDLVFEHLDVDRGAILLWNEKTSDLDIRCVKQRNPAADEIRFSRTIADKVLREKVAILTSDAMSDERFAGGQSIVDLNIRSAMAAPLWNADRVEGLIYADTPLRARAFDHFDLDVLSAMGNHAAVAIEQSRLQQSIFDQQLVRQKLERYHSPSVIEHITARGSIERLDADEMDVTVMFADVVGFTSRCETMSPGDIAELLNRYFSEMAECVFRHDGTLDKFIGDCMMAVFGAPLAADDHAERGAQAALDMRDALDGLNAELDEHARLEFRIGMHSGRVVAGDIGSVRRSDYTVLGSTVNVAARLESGAAKPGQIVISDRMNAIVEKRFSTRGIGEISLKGISLPIACFELLGPRDRAHGST